MRPCQVGTIHNLSLIEGHDRTEWDDHGEKEDSGATIIVDLWGSERARTGAMGIREQTYDLV